MLQKLKYEALNFDKYQSMRKKFLSSEFVPQEVTEIDLSRCGSIQLPPIMCLKLMANLQILNLSRNKINQFNGTVFSKACPNLIALDLSENEITGLTDIIEIGILENLQRLDFSKNPVCTAYTRIQIIQMLFYPDKYGKYDPVQVLTATYSHVPNYQYTKKQFETLKRNERILEKNTFELQRADFKEDSKINKYDHKNTLLKYSMITCPMNRKCRFKNLIMLNNDEINRLEILRASGADRINEVLEHGEEYYFKTFTRSINEYIQQKRDEKVVKKVVYENQALQDKYIDHYKKRIIRAASSDPIVQIQSQQHKDNSEELDHIEEGEDDLNYLSKVDTVNAIQRRNTKNARLQAIELWEKPMDVIYKDAEYNILISEHKKMMLEYEKGKKKQQKAYDDYQEEQRRRFKEEKEEKQKLRTQSQTTTRGSFTDTHSPSKLTKRRSFHSSSKKLQKNHFEEPSIDPDELPSDRESRSLFRRKRSKPRFNFNLQREDNYGTSESDLEEQELEERHFSTKIVEDEYANNGIKTNQKKGNKDPMTFFQIKKMKGHLTQDQQLLQIPQQQQQQQISESPIKEDNNNLRKSSQLNSPQRVRQLHQEKGITFEQLVSQEENQDLANLKAPDKVNLNVDEIMPSEEQGLPSNRKFEILHTQSEQQQNIFETKKSLENAMNVLQYSRYRDKLHGQKRDLFHTNKKLSSYDEVFEILQKSFPGIKVDAQFCHLIQDILYYVNDYDPATEPKITERETLRKLKEKNLTAEELDQCQKELEVLDAIKLRSQKLNKQGLKRIEKKEIHQAEENAVLAAHYFRLKKYYKTGEFDKYVRQLNLEVQNEVIDINIQGKQKVAPVTRQPIKAYDNTKFSVTKQLKYAEAVKNYLPKAGEHIAAVKARYPSFVPGVPFEKMMENYLKKMQDDFNKKDSKVLSLEERMIRYAKEFKESASKRENLVQRIERLIENQEVRKKLEEFFKWEKEEMKARNDQEYCFQFFVKLLREGKIK